MAFELSNARDETKEVVVTINGQPLTISYQPSKITRKWQKSIEERARAIDEKIAAEEPLTVDEEENDARFLLDLMTGWDVEDKGKPVKPSVDILVNGLGYLNIAKMTEAILRDINPKLMTN